MGIHADNTRRTPATAEVRRLAELARAAGMGDTPGCGVDWCRDALLLVGADTENPLLADVLRWQGSVLRDSGLTAQAEPLYHQSLGITYVKVGRVADAEHAYARALSIAHDRGDLLTEGAVHENRAELQMQQNDLRGALASIARALEIAEQRRDGPRRAIALKLRGTLERRSNNPRAAMQTLRSALTWSTAGEDALLAAEI